MWGLGALRDGAAGLVKQGAGAVKHGVEAGAKLLENLEEVIIVVSARMKTGFCLSLITSLALTTRRCILPCFTAGIVQTSFARNKCNLATLMLRS